MTYNEKGIILYIIKYKKPLIRSSILLKHLQRAAGGGIAVMGKSENGPVRASRNIRSRYDVTARYSRACMLVHD